MSSVKYPRTPHLPFSPGYAYDDEKLIDIDNLRSEEIVCTEKMDGENTTLYQDHWHARSINGIRKHESRDWMAAYWAKKRAVIARKDIRVCGENMYAQHTIPYKDLLSYFYVHSVWEANECYSWDDTVKFCANNDFTLVPVLYRGPFSFEALTSVAAKLDVKTQEGFVVRRTQEIYLDTFHCHCAKWVRPNHVSDQQKHWFASKVIKNGLKI